MAALAGIAALGLHARFAAVDPRAPTDLGHYYDALRVAVLGTGGADTPYTAALAALFRAVGPSQAAMEAIEGLWLAVALAGAWAAARAAAGPVAGATAVALAVAFPQTHVLARTHWIHHPEAAALLGALGIGAAMGWVPGAVRGGERGRVLEVVAAIGAGALLLLGLTTRPTGIPFGLPVAVLLAWGAWRARAWAALGAVGAAALAGLAVVAPDLGTYLSRKAASAEGYAASVTAPWSQLLDAIGAPAAPLAAALAVAGLRAFVPGGREGGGAAGSGGAVTRAGAALAGLALLWIAGAALAVMGFHVGADNFPLLGWGLALLAGLGAATASWGRLGLAAAAAVAAVLQGTTLLDARLVAPLAGVLGPWVWAGPLNYLRPWWEPTTVAEVARAVGRVCAGPLSAPDGRCLVVAERGLFNPSWEDGGTFALFLAGMGRVAVVTPPVLWDERGGVASGDRVVHGVVEVRCREGVAPASGGRFAAQEARFAALVAEVGEDGPVAWLGDPEACTQTWYAAPAGGLRVE